MFLDPEGAGSFEWHSRFAPIELLLMVNPPVFWLAWRLTFNIHMAVGNGSATFS
jgi:hypothetical protein